VELEWDRRRPQGIRGHGEEHSGLAPDLLAPTSVTRLSNAALSVAPNSNDLHRQDPRHRRACRQSIRSGLAEVTGSTERIYFDVEDRVLEGQGKLLCNV
jgi:hypothetical protein